MDEPDQYWTRLWKSASSELRGFIAAEAARRQGSDSFSRFHNALESAVHEQLRELGDEGTLLGAAQQAGLDVNRFRADWVDPQLAQSIQQSHLRAAAQWNVAGTPTLIFPKGYSFHLELSNTPLGKEALETFQAVENLAVTQPYIQLFHRTNSGE